MISRQYTSFFQHLDDPLAFDYFSVFNQRHSLHVNFFIQDYLLTVSEDIFWDPSRQSFSSNLIATVDNKRKSFALQNLRYHILEDAWEILCGDLRVRGEPSQSVPEGVLTYSGFEIDTNSLRYILKECRSVICPLVSISVTTSDYLFRFVKNDSIVELTANGKVPQNTSTVVISRTVLCKALFTCLNTPKNSLAHLFTLTIRQRGEQAFFVIQHLRDSAEYSTRTTLQIQSVR